MTASRLLFSRHEHTHGAVAVRDSSHHVDVFDDAEQGQRIGVAYRSGFVRLPEGAAVLFRLVVGGEELSGFFLCVGRQFLPLGSRARSTCPPVRAELA
jgi:hypothetical protein